ncbi:hypothetical protein [Porcincola intestinalis]|jgi:uncharacterized Zn-finger protein|uniref:Uncharacterized protein n=1 Tax=Porcincola intestinalis TaxID=2606632 RepID=A0A6L5X5K6_9FIRM|nr:hypothetical protein [Porcincola intestinalis]MDY5579932.1 hypothetical protein [Porcincola intestinalis]MSS13612.1 hypothetical protein [Porcincola intestinalis]
MKEDKMTTRVCPICGKKYTGIPATSREDNQTLICPDCGTRQALASIGVGADEREEILHIIHENTR